MARLLLPLLRRAPAAFAGRSGTRRCSLGACASYRLRDGVHPLWQSPITIPGGSRQSPINIQWRDSVYDPHLKPLEIRYDPDTCLHMWNNGYSFLVEFEDSTDKSKSVTWIIKKKAIEVDEDQLEVFRMLLFTSAEEDEKRMVDNFRPLQPIMDRTVRSSFQKHFWLDMEKQSVDQMFSVREQGPLQGTLHL